MGCIYAHVLKVNTSDQFNWMYIGQAEDILKRWAQKTNAYRDCTFIYRELCKYGWDAFDHIILEDNIPTDQLNEREMYWIKKYHTCQYDPEYSGGFNLTFGGDGTRGPKPALQGKTPKNIPMLTELKYKPVKCVNSGAWNNIEYVKGQTWNSHIDCYNYFKEKRSWFSHRFYPKWDAYRGPLFAPVDCDVEPCDPIEQQKRTKAKQREAGAWLGSMHKTGSNIDYMIYCEETGETFEKVSDCLKKFGFSRSALNYHVTHPEKRSSVKGYHFKRIPKTTANS